MVGSQVLRSGPAPRGCRSHSLQGCAAGRAVRPPLVCLVAAPRSAAPRSQVAILSRATRDPLQAQPPVDLWLLTRPSRTRSTVARVAQLQRVLPCPCGACSEWQHLGVCGRSFWRTAAGSLTHKMSTQYGTCVLPHGCPFPVTPTDCHMSFCDQPAAPSVAHRMRPIPRRTIVDDCRYSCIIDH